jgi:hypothetical protein
MAEHMTVERTIVEQSTAGFDYNAEAELFPSRYGKSRRHAIAYKRFGRASDAIRFAIEELGPEFLLGAYLEVDEERYNGEQIRRLYESVNYPLLRGAAV